MTGIKAIERACEGYGTARRTAAAIIEQVGLGVPVPDVAFEFIREPYTVRLICAAYLNGREEGRAAALCSPECALAVESRKHPEVPR